MKKYFLILILSGAACSCVNAVDRLTDAQKKYPEAIVNPTTSILSREGFDVMVEDTVANQIYVLNYYPFSTTKIMSIRNIK